MGHYIHQVRKTEDSPWRDVGERFEVGAEQLRQAAHNVREANHENGWDKLRLMAVREVTRWEAFGQPITPEMAVEMEQTRAEG